MLTVLLLALSVSVDACAAALSIRSGQASPRTGLELAGWFGGFQTGMSLLGGLAGDALSEHLRRFGAVFAFGLLLYLGATQLLSALRGEETVVQAGSGRWRMAALAFATSVDALAVGVSLAYLPVGLVPAALLIGLVTGSLTLLCALAGGRVRFRRLAAGGGGAALVMIGVKILAEGW